MNANITIAVATRRIRYLLGFFIIALVISGLTAIPLPWETNLLNHLIGEGTAMEKYVPSLSRWITHIHQGLTETDKTYPFILYGTDWLAFAHVVIAIAFIGPFRDPLKNRWVIEFGMISCILIIPTALIFGFIRGIPLLWRIIDCSFGVVGIIPLWISLRYVQRIQSLL